MTQKAMAIEISEIFTSIQGESTFTGCPCTFIRLAGCNLACNYCDTSYARGPGELFNIGSLVARVLELGCPLVEITGGEPLIQQETPLLALALLESGHTVLVETNGSLNIDRLDRRCTIIMDIKCPGSGQAEMNDYANFGRLKPHDQVKFVISDRKDFDFASDLLKANRLKVDPGNIIFSPVYGTMDPATLAAWIQEDRLFNVRLQIQLHKLLWPEVDKGI